MEGVVVRLSASASWLRRALVTLAAVSGLAAAQPAAAWSELGHRVVADIAYARLTPEAKAKVDELIALAPLAGEPSCPVASLADAAAYPDCVGDLRQFRDLRRMHEEARPLCPGESRRDPCDKGECVSAAVKRAQAALVDPLTAPADRLFALEKLAHFMGDLHQPLDMIDNRDDAGRDIRVLLPGSTDRKLNLHDFWNDNMAAVAVGSEELGLRWLEPVARSGRGWEEGGVDAWAAETAAVARDIYAHLPEPPPCGREPRDPEALDGNYVAAAVPLAREQLAKAGVRLAALLNAALR